VEREEGMNGRARTGEVSILKASGVEADRGMLREITDLLASCENLYPGIDLWLRRTALPGILAGERAGFLAYSGEAAAPPGRCRRSPALSVLACVSMSFIRASSALSFGSRPRRFSCP
jgi:hypothetical protein